MQSLTASTPCKPRNGFAFHSSLSICESFVNYCNLLLQFTANKTSGYETSDYIFKYIPDYLVDIEVDENPVSAVYTFTSVDGEEYVSISIRKGIFEIKQYDNEHTTVEKVIINGYSGYIITSTIDDMNEIVWTNNESVFSALGNISVKELIKICENIDERN